LVGEKIEESKTFCLVIIWFFY